MEQEQENFQDNNTQCYSIPGQNKVGEARPLQFVVLPNPMLLPAMTNIFLKDLQGKAKPSRVYFQYAISINILRAKLPRIRNKELEEVLIVSKGIHVTERKTKGSYIQKDMRQRPNQQLPESKTVPEAVSEDLPVDSALEFARDLA